VVRDTLSPYIDTSSFQYLASSHHAVIQLFGSAIAFTFPKINLVDSATNPPLSEGWIQFKVRTKPNLPLATQIRNTASIYFDLNPAIVTNTTVNTVQIDTPHTHVGISTTQTTDRNLLLYPNPVREVLHLVGYSPARDISVTDMMGRRCTAPISGRDIDVAALPAGVYVLHVSDRGTTIVRRFIKE
jgi:hypothetical protein